MGSRSLGARVERAGQELGAEADPEHGHLVISLYLLLWPYMPYPDWVHALIWCSLTLVLSLVMLPFVKGGTMAIIFRTKAKA